MTTRRGFLGGLASALAAAVSGATLTRRDLSPWTALDWNFTRVKTGPVVEVKPLPAWSVGDYGEMNWKVIFAETEEEAIRQWCIETHDEDPDDPCDCGCGLTYQECGNYGYSLPETAKRSPHFDDPKNREPSTPEVFKAGWTVYCDRCGNEASQEDGECDVIPHADPEKHFDIVVCHDCMTDDELRKVCPDHYRFDDEDEEIA